MSESAPTIKLHYEIYGSGDPILCIHGFGANLYTWRHLIAPLSQNHQLILVDLKGCGASPKPKDRQYSAQDHAELVYQLILQLDLKKLTLVGNSFGGALSLLLAIRLHAQDRLSALFLINPGAYKEYAPLHLNLLRVPLLGALIVYLCPPSMAAKIVLRLAMYDRKKVTRKQINAYAGPIAATGGRHALLETAKQIIPRNLDELTSKYKSISVPTFILFGEQYRIVKPIVGDKLHAAIPNSELEKLDHCGHIPQEEKPAETADRILKFLSTLNTSA